MSFRAFGFVPRSPLLRCFCHTQVDVKGPVDVSVGASGEVSSARTAPEVFVFDARRLTNNPNAILSILLSTVTSIDLIVLILERAFEVGDRIVFHWLTFIQELNSVITYTSPKMSLR